MAGIIYSDYIRPLHLFKHSDAAANLTMKLTIATIGVFCVLSGFLVERVASIFQVINTIIGMTSGAVFGVFSLGMLCPRANAKVIVQNNNIYCACTTKTWFNKQAAIWSTVISMICLCWIITGSQVLVNSGELRYEPLDARIDGCEARNISIILKNITLPELGKDR